jgi:hypothetical protein
MSGALKPPVVGIWITSCPSGDGVYLEYLNRETGESKVSVKYPNREAAVGAMRRNAVEWRTK